LVETLPWLRLGELPTAVVRHAALGAALGVDGLFIKHDDRSSRLYGGGKLRKLELILAAARERGCRRVVTVGGAGSNHTLATARFARHLGLEAVLLLAPQRPDEALRHNLLASQLAGARMVFFSSQHDAERAQRRLARDRATPTCAIAAGGSSPLGNVGFVNAAFELAEQVRAGEVPQPTRLYVAMGTGGCAAGLAVGLAAAGLPTEVVAVRASSVATSSRSRLARMCHRTADFLHARAPAFPLAAGERLPRIDGSALGAGYARATPAGRAARHSAAAHGVALDLTYTAKCLAALARTARALSREPATATTLFWHTHHGAALDVRGADPARLPPPLQAYFR
jgi:D-cysteine desulfhydrase